MGRAISVTRRHVECLHGFAQPPTDEERASLRRILEGEGDHQLPPTDDDHAGEELE